LPKFYGEIPEFSSLNLYHFMQTRLHGNCGPNVNIEEPVRKISKCDLKIVSTNALDEDSWQLHLINTREEKQTKLQSNRAPNSPALLSFPCDN